MNSFIEIVDPADISNFQAPTITNEIDREAITSTILNYFTEGFNLVFLNGEAGIGKTTTLSQFVKLNKKDSIIIFLNEYNRSYFIYELIIKDLYIQICHWLGENFEVAGDVSERELISKITNLRYRLKNENRNAYIILDGLHTLIESDEELLKKLISIFPQSDKNIKILASSSDKKFNSLFKSPLSTEIQLPLLTNQEAISMLPEKYKNRDAEIIFSRIKKKPSAISDIIRLLESGSNLDSIDSELSDQTSPIEIEWQNNSSKISAAIDVICIVTFSEASLALDDLSEYTKKPKQEIKSLLLEITFISIKFNDEKIYFVSPEIKELAKIKLASHKNKTIEKIIYFLSEDKLKNLTNLSEIYKKESNYPEAIKVLSHENMLGFIEHKKSLTELVKQLDIGLEAADHLGQESNILKFSHLKGLVRGIEASRFLKNEINSLLESEDISGATDLAMTSRSNEEKLQLLALICKHHKENGRAPDEPLSAEMKSLISTIDPSIIGLERTIEIAVEIFPVMPEEALDLITKSDPLGIGGANNSDYAFFRFSLSSLLKEPESMSILENNSKNLTNDKKKIIDSLKLFKRGTPAEAILKEFKNEKSPGDEILILRSWVSSFPKSPDNQLLINRALELALSTTNYTANARFFFDLMTATCYLNPIESGRQIYERIASQVETAKAIGPTADYIRLQLEIYKFERSASILSNRIIEVLDECLNEIEDKSVALLGLSLIDRFIKTNNIKIRREISSEKEKLFNLIIANTADQFEILKDSIKVESSINLKNSILWAERLNIKSRTEEAYELIISHVCKLQESPSIEEICNLIAKISIESLRKRAILALLKMSIGIDEITPNEWRRITKFKNRFSDYTFNCDLNINFLKLGKKQSFLTETDLDKFKESIIENWGKIDGDWKKVDLGFYIHSKTRSLSESFSSDVLRKTLEMRGTEYLYSDEVAQAHLDSVDLALRVLSHMIKEKLKLDDEINKMVTLIGNLPRLSFKIKALSRLCSILQNAEKIDRAAQIIEGEILRELENIEPRSSLFRSCFYWAAPVIAKYNLEEFKKYLAKVDYDNSFQDESIIFTFNYYFQKITLGDPFDPIKNYKADLSFKCINDLLSIISMTKDINTIYVLLKHTSKVIIEKYHKGRTLRTPQYRDIKHKFEKVISDIIAPSNFINHNGYLICANALLLDIEQCKEKSKWNDLIDSANLISNQSDKAFILSSIAEIIPTSLKEFRSDLYKNSFELIEQLPSGLDKINRYEDLCEKVKSFDKKIAKDCIKKALGISTALDDDDADQKRRSLIDIAYSMDNEYGESLSTTFDSDPIKRSAIEENIKKKKEELKLADDICSIKEISFSYKIPSISWNSLGKLNANNMKVDRKHSNFRSLVKSACLYDPHDMYAIFSFYISAISVSAKGEENAKKILLPIYNTLVSNIRLFLKMYKVGNFRLEEKGIVDNEHIVIEPDRQHAAIDFLRDWASKLSVKNIIIIDKYLQLDDLAVIAKAINNDPNFKIRIFTVQKREQDIIKSSGSNNSLDDVIEDYWKNNICSDSLPEIHLTFASIKEEPDEEFPIHDRWWLSEASGLRLGTSINSLGRSFSEISTLSTKQLQNIKQTLGGFLDESQREIRGKKIKYKNYKI